MKILSFEAVNEVLHDVIRNQSIKQSAINFVFLFLFWNHVFSSLIRYSRVDNDLKNLEKLLIFGNFLRSLEEYIFLLFFSNFLFIKISF